MMRTHQRNWKVHWNVIKCWYSMEDKRFFIVKLGRAFINRVNLNQNVSRFEIFAQNQSTHPQENKDISHFSPTSSIFLPSFHLTYQQHEYEQWKCWKKLSDGEKSDDNETAENFRPNWKFMMRDNNSHRTHSFSVSSRRASSCVWNLSFFPHFTFFFCYFMRWSGGKFAKQNFFSAASSLFLTFQVRVHAFSFSMPVECCSFYDHITCGMYN